MSEASLGIFLKVPRPGEVKTRIAAELGDRAATELYTALLRDTVTLALKEPSRHLHFFVSGGSIESALGPGWNPSPDRHHAHQQCGRDLGHRLDHAFVDAHALDPRPLVILGSDSPDLPHSLLCEALEALDAGADVVLGPVADGGVWCIGLGRPVPHFFSDLPWSSPGTGQALVDRAHEMRLELVETGPWYDCDEVTDLVDLSHRLRECGDTAPATRAWLAHHPRFLRLESP